MHNEETMDLSIDEWEQISHSHPVSSDAMMTFLENVIDNQLSPQDTVNIAKRLTCSTCSRVFSRIDTLKRHMKTHALGKEFQCSFCPKSFLSS